MKIVLSFVFGILICCISVAQNPAIRGIVKDKDAGGEIPGILVLLVKGNDTINKTITGIDGDFLFENCPPGRYTLQMVMTGYESATLDGEHISAKEWVVVVEMEEKVQSIKEVEVVAESSGGRGDAANEMATVSARRFSLEETNRYAGSRGDPARMASNYAGVSGTDDSRNDIVVRGNSPTGVLWKVDGIWIPNPSHFAIAGSQGGPVSVLNNKALANSDFYTGAFPAEYGNSISSVFDLKFRNGNNRQYEFTAQVGILGTELTAEGPFSKKSKSSFLIAYRYATFDLFRILGMSPETLKSIIGTSAIPAYQDLNMKLNFPLSSRTTLSFMAIGGASSINTVLSDQTKPESLNLYGDNDRDQLFRTKMGVLGMNLTHQLDENSLLQISLGTGVENQHASHNYFVRHIDSSGTEPVYVYDTLPQPLMRYTFNQVRTGGTVSYTRKISSRHVIKGGISAYHMYIHNVDSSLTPAHDQWLYRWDFKGHTALAEAYFQWKYRISDVMTLISGLHSQYFQLSNSFSPVEPRIGLKWKVAPKHVISLGTGYHSQIQPVYTYVYNVQVGNLSGRFNQKMDMTRSIHVVAGHDMVLNPTTRLKTEVYYQYLMNIPVERDSSAFSMVNVGSGFSRFFPDKLLNTGTARNYGIELTLEKFFSRKLFFLITGTLYNSTYEGSDGITRNTDYNGRYILNGLVGSEFKAGKKGQFTIGAKFTWGGGKRYGLVDTTATIANNELVFLDNQYNEFQFRDYLRFDIKINYRYNANKVTHEIGIDVVNLTNSKNLLALAYTGDPLSPIAERYQLGLMPILYYRLDF
jgi:hypothetical protein